MTENHEHERCGEEAASSSEELVDSLISECGETCVRHAETLVREACEANPEHSEDLWHRFIALRDAGVIGPIPGARVGAAPSGDPDRGPESVGPYRILSELGRGGQATVFLAEDERLHRLVALKVLRGLGPVQERMLPRFRREAEVASRLEHPGICPVYDAGTESGVSYIALRFVPGRTLADRIRETRDPKGVESVLVLIEKTARAVHAAHEAGVIHRDLKPGNIMVTPGGEPVVLDFGLAGDEEAGPATLTRTGDVLGTPAYMSPEQLESTAGVRLDRRTDVYSLGVTLYECLTLERPFRAPSREALVRAIREAEPANPRKLNPRVSSDLRVVLETALEKDRDRRYQTALDLAEDLRRIREGKPIAARRISAPGRLLRWAKRRPYGAALIATVFIGLPLLAGLAAFIIANRPAEAEAARQAVLARVERELEAGYRELRRGASDRAVRAFDRVLAERPESAEALAGKAIALMNAGKHRECLHALDDRQQTTGVHPALVRLRADALRALGRSEQASAAEKGRSEPAGALDRFLSAMRAIRPGARDADAATRRMAFNQLITAALTAPAARYLYHLEAAHGANLLGTRVSRRMVSTVAAALTANWPDRAEAWSWAAKVLVAHDPDSAVKAAEQAVRLDGEGAPAFEALGAALLAKGQATRDRAALDRALEAFRNALDRTPRSASARCGLGEVLLEKKEPEPALAEFQVALETHPDHARALRGTGRAHAMAGRPKAAAECFRRVVALGVADAEAGVRLADALRQTGGVEEAIAVLEKAVSEDVSSARAWSLLGELRLEKRRWPEAIQAFENALERRPDQATARARLARAHAGLGLMHHRKREWARALACFARARKVDPEARVPRQAFFECSLNEGSRLRRAASRSRRPLERFQHLEKAVTHFQKSAELDPGRFDAWFLLGTAQLESGDPGGAVPALRKAVALRPEEPLARVNLGRALAKTGENDAAVNCFHRAIELDEDCVPAHFHLGATLESAKLDAEEAIDGYETVLELNANHLAARLGLAATLIRLGRKSAAAEAVREVVRRAPNHAAANRKLGRLLVSNGQWSDAIDPLVKAARFRPCDAELLNALGTAYSCTKQWKRAEAALRLAVRCAPDSAEASCNLGWALRRQGRFEEAVLWFRKGHELGIRRGEKWTYPSGEWLEEAERLPGFRGRLDAVLRGEDVPKHAAELVGLAEVCRTEARYAAAARFWSEAFRLDSAVVEDLDHERRGAAASVAVLAAAGEGKDGARVSIEERAAWRRLALAWLEAELAARREAGDQERLDQVVRPWQSDPDLAWVRDPERLATLPEPERRVWQAFWAAVAEAVSEPL